MNSFSGLTATAFPYRLQFKQPAGTSRGTLHHKISWMLRVTDAQGRTGIGECGPLPGLSYDDRPDFGTRLLRLCEQFNAGEEAVFQESLGDYPSIRFGFEMALRDLAGGGQRLLFPSAFTQGVQPIPINGLIWMGDVRAMERQIADKLLEGYTTLKMKVGAIDFSHEYQLLADIRERFSAEELTLRVDANGAWSPAEAGEKLNQLAALELHSIEQPIAAGQWEALASLIAKSPVPVALDEELIGLSETEVGRLLDTVRPPFIVLKPTLLGGFAASESWIAAAEARGIGWWVTSALESNIGLNAIAQWTATLGSLLPQGLGTGSLYTNNFACPLQTEGGFLHYRPQHGWELDHFRDNL